MKPPAGGTTARDATTTTRPYRARTIPGTTAFAALNALVRLRSSMCFQVSTSVSRSEPPAKPPTPATRMSILPRAATTPSAKAVIALRSITSTACMTSRWRSAAATRWDNRSRSPSTAYGTATIAPSARRRSVTACPSAPVPPATTATRSASAGVIVAGSVRPAWTEGGLIQAGVAPVRGQPGAPVRSQPGAPVRGQPGAPVRGQPGAPLRSQPGAPVRGQRGAPLRSQPGAPVRSQPGAPLRGQPGQLGAPIRSRPVAPGRGQPGTPHRGQLGGALLGGQSPAWPEARAGSARRSLRRPVHDRGALNFVVTDLAHVERFEVVPKLLEGLLERRQRLARARERRRAGQEVVLHVGVVDPALFDLRDDDAERRVRRADQVGALRPRVEALRQRLLQELVDPAENRRERAAREPLVLLVEEAEGDEVRRFELKRPRLLGGLGLLLHERPVHADDLERLLLEVVRLLDVERENLEDHRRLDDQDDRDEVGLELVEDRAPVVAVRRPVDSRPGRDHDDRVHEPVEALDRLGEALDMGRREIALVGARLALGAGQQTEELPVIADGLLVERQDPAAVALDL